MRPSDAIRLSRRALTTIKGNLLGFAFYVAALPLAAAGSLNALIAGGAITFSRAFIVSNFCASFRAAREA